MEAREVLTRLGCDRHHYIGDGVYCGIDASGQLWLITERDGGWHQIALDLTALGSLYRYARGALGDVE